MNNYLILFARNNCSMVQRFRILSACEAFPYTIKFECAAGECGANLQSVQSGSYFVKRAGLGNNEFCLRGLMMAESSSYSGFSTEVSCMD